MKYPFILLRERAVVKDDGSFSVFRLLGTRASARSADFFFVGYRQTFIKEKRQPPGCPSKIKNHASQVPAQAPLPGLLPSLGSSTVGLLEYHSALNRNTRQGHAVNGRSAALLRKFPRGRLFRASCRPTAPRRWGFWNTIVP